MLGYKLGWKYFEMSQKGGEDVISSSSTTFNIEQLRDSIVKDAETPQLKFLMEKCNCSEIEEWRDKDSYDLMHYAILSNNQEAVLLLFMKGLFREPYRPDLPYLHLACELGFRTIAGLLLDYRKTDDAMMVYEHGEFPVPVRAYAGKLENSNPNTFFLDSKTNTGQYPDPKLGRITPLDVAAAVGNLHCVRFLLDRYDLDNLVSQSSRKKPLTHLSLATSRASSAAVKLLLLERNSKEDIATAIDVAIRENQPACLDLLLSQNIPTNSMYSGMNLFHVMYKYPLSFYKDGQACFSEATSVLVKHGCDVNTHSPSRTYPLYSFLSCESIYSSSAAIDGHVDCLRVLLSSGANPNFDEAGLENADKTCAYGREAYPSALFCLFHTAYTVGKAQKENLSVVRQITLTYLRILLQYGADVRKVAAIYHLFDDEMSSNMTVLHEYIRCSTVLGVDRHILNHLIRLGVNPMAKFKGMLPLTLYSVGMCASNQGKEERNGQESTETALTNFSHLLSLCHHLPLGLVKEYQSNMQEASQYKTLCGEYDDEISNYLTSVRSLKHESLVMIWKLCSFKKENVERLPLPTELKNCIVPTV